LLSIRSEISTRSRVERLDSSTAAVETATTVDREQLTAALRYSSR